MSTFEYDAVRIRQTAQGPWIVFFAAPAIEIDRWSGVPQKRELGTQETTGFQRQVNVKRLESLNKFYTDNANTVQNALLGATRKSENAKVEFIPDANSKGEFSQTGKLRIAFEDLTALPLRALLEMLKQTLVERVPTLAQADVPQSMVIKLKESIRLASPEVTQAQSVEGPDTEGNGNGNGDSDQERGEESENSEDALFAEESHVLEFYQEVAARCMVLEELPSFVGDEFAGFSRDAISSFLKPVVLVDGQHRLVGAIEHARDMLGKSPFKENIEQAIAAGKAAQEVEEELWPKACRRLPVSLLICDDPAEHVFQFVIVNQKATPIGRALLGTIVATTLSDDELSRVSDRLKAAGILLEEARHVAFLSRSPESPFSGFVEKGLASDSNERLPFSVMVSLVKIFRNLKDGRLWGDKNDYADLWRRKYLDTSGIVQDWSASTKYDGPYEYWRSDEGPWRKAFIEFWKCVKRKLASDDPEDQNCWGRTRKSNLFNKIYLHILMADFFQYLTETRKGIESIQAISGLVDDWLDEVQPSYFRRDWKLENQKKDVPGIRKSWAILWVGYRKNPQRAPAVKEFRQAAP